jgi:hypothetical protein
VESKSISDWFERSKHKEISAKDELLFIKQKNVEFFKRENHLLDSISTLNIIHARDSLSEAEKGKNISDSLLLFRDSLRISDSISNVKKREYIIKDAQQIRKNLIAGGIILIVLLTSLYFNNTARIHKKRRKAENKAIQEELKSTKSEMKLLSTLAINHDIEKFIPQLPLFLNNTNEDNRESLQKAVVRFKNYYLATKQLGNSLTNTIISEITIARESAEVFLYMYGSKTIPHIITNFEGNEEINNLEIPKNMLTSFIANSVKHGAIGKESISVIIDVSKIPNGYYFKVEDNGAGFDSLNLETKPSDKGINLIVNQVQNFNQNNNNYQIEFSPENIVNKPNNSGVIVTFKLIKT